VQPRTPEPLRRLIDDPVIDAFPEASWRRGPVVRSGTAAGVVPFMGWPGLDTLLEAHPDLLVVRDGILQPAVDSLTGPEARAWFAHGWSIVVRGCDEIDPGLRLLAQAFVAALGGEAAVQVFATPASRGSFGWHYDCEDVFIVQTVGIKEYRLRENTVNPSPTLDAMPRDMHFERETTPVLECALIPGDWLYIPRGWWHRAFAIRDSLSISVGLLGDDARGSRPPRRRAWKRDGPARTSVRPSL
jgi:hypothetical protein